MINQLHGLIFRPERGWDPIDGEYAEKYDAYAGNEIDVELISDFEAFAGGFQGKRLLDLGGGPGHYGIEFAKRGARVVWHDVSATYKRIVERKAREAGCSIETSVGYLEDADRFRAAPFDLIFMRRCWYYGVSDRKLARLIYSILAEDGRALIETDIQENQRDRRGSYGRAVNWVYRHLGFKLGHPFPPRGRAAQHLSKFPFESISTDDRHVQARRPVDRIYLKKGGRP